MSDFVFFSYAHEDKSQIDGVYLAVRAAGVPAWMDEPPGPCRTHGIPPGADWELFVRSRLTSAAVIVAFLSRASTTKSGYVQKELRLALEAVSKRPIGSNTLIPVLLEPCDVPRVTVDTVSLHQLQWYRLYEKGVDPLVSFLKVRFGVTSLFDSAEFKLQDLQNEVNWLKAQIPNPDHS